MNLPSPPDRWTIELANAERVNAIASFGFTERQARFLTNVLLHSGVFVERQYCSFAGIVHWMPSPKRELPNARLQPRPLTIASAAVGCKPRLAGWSLPIEGSADDRFAFPTVPGPSCCFFRIPGYPPENDERCQGMSGALPTGHLDQRPDRFTTQTCEKLGVLIPRKGHERPRGLIPI